MNSQLDRRDLLKLLTASAFVMPLQLTASRHKQTALFR